MKYRPLLRYSRRNNHSGSTRTTVPLRNDSSLFLSSSLSIHRSPSFFSSPSGDGFRTLVSSASFVSSSNSSPLSIVADNLSVYPSIGSYRYFSTHNASSSSSSTVTTTTVQGNSSSTPSSSSSTPTSSAPTASTATSTDPLASKDSHSSTSSSSSSSSSSSPSSPSKPVKSDWHFIVRGGAILGIFGIPLAIIHEIRYDEEIREWFEDHYPQELEQIRQYSAYFSLFDIPYAFPREYVRVHQQNDYVSTATRVPLYLTYRTTATVNTKNTVKVHQSVVEVPGTTKLSTFLHDYKEKYFRNSDTKDSRSTTDLVTVSTVEPSPDHHRSPSKSVSSSPSLSSLFILPSPLKLQIPYYHRYTLESLLSLKNYIHAKENEIRQKKTILHELMNTSLSLLHPRIQTLQSRIQILEEDIQNLRSYESNFSKYTYQPDLSTYKNRKVDSRKKGLSSSSSSWLWSNKSSNDENDSSLSSSTVPIEEEYPYYSDEESIKDEEILSSFNSSSSPVYRIIYSRIERNMVQDRLLTYYLPKPVVTTATAVTTGSTSIGNGTTTTPSTEGTAAPNSSSTSTSISDMFTKFFK